MAKAILPIKAGENDIGISSAHLGKHFGRVPYYALFDSDTGEFSLVKNTNHHFGGTDTPADVVANAGATFVITSHLGSKPYNMFRERGITVLDANDADTVGDAARLWVEGKLQPMKEPEKSCCSH